MALVDAHGRVQLRSVQVGRDNGRSVTILSGLQPNDRVIATPPDALETGDQVRVAKINVAGAGHAG